MECIKMVDTLVDTFIEKREQGELKGVSFVEYVVSIINLIGELAPYGYTFIESVEKIVEYAHRYGTALKEIDDLNNVTTIRE